METATEEAKTMDKIREPQGMFSADKSKVGVSPVMQGVQPGRGSHEASALCV